MNLRLPAILIVVTGAAAVAGLRALHPAGASAPAGGAASGAPGFAETQALATASSALPVPAASATRAVERATVYVAGHVVRPGVYALAPGARANDALRAAGGASAGADLVAVNLAEPVRDGEELVVPAKGAEGAEAASLRRADGSAETAASPGTPRKKHRRKRRRHRASAALAVLPGAAERAAAAPEADAATAARADSAPADAPAETIDLNTADENALETLPGIGPSLASRIVAFREVNGPFTSPDDLLDVGGMTQGRLDAIAPYVTTR